jgi:hypothetical protein
LDSTAESGMPQTRSCSCIRKFSQGLNLNTCFAAALYISAFSTLEWAVVMFVLYSFFVAACRIYRNQSSMPYADVDSKKQSLAICWLMMSKGVLASS